MHEKGLLIIGFAVLVALLILFTAPSEKTLAPENGGIELTACRATGCSGQVCAEEDVITTCEYREEYACYQSARCERQLDGRCGWTETPEFKQCFSSVGAVAI